MQNVQLQKRMQVVRCRLWEDSELSLREHHLWRTTNQMLRLKLEMEMALSLLIALKLPLPEFPRKMLSLRMGLIEWVE